MAPRSSLRDVRRRERHHGAVRTTVTLDPDVARSLRKLARERRQSFEVILDEVHRRGLSSQAKVQRRKRRFVVEPHDGAFRPGLALDELNQLVDELDTERVAERIRALRLRVASVACMKAESVPRGR